jgi:hypothetical protein
VWSCWVACKPIDRSVGFDCSNWPLVFANDGSDETVLRGLEMGWHSPVFTLDTSFLALYLNRVSRIIGFVDSVTDLSVVSDVGSLFSSTTAMAMVLKAQ